MSHFQVRNKKREDGGYELSYGKGSKKLTAVMKKLAGKWLVTNGCGSVPSHGTDHDTMRECKTAWGEWAQKTYDGAAQSPSPRDGQPPSTKTTPPCRLGPPVRVIQTSGPPKHTRTPSVPDDGWPSSDNPCVCDPFDPKFHTKTADGKHRLTALGALDEVYNWMVRNTHRITVNRRLEYPWCNVLLVLRRELPDHDYSALDKEIEIGKSRPVKRPKLTPGFLNATIERRESCTLCDEDHIPF